MAKLPEPVSEGGKETDPHWVCHQPPGGTHHCAQTDPEHCSAGEGEREEGRERGRKEVRRERKRERGSAGKEGGKNRRRDGGREGGREERKRVRKKKRKGSETKGMRGKASLFSCIGTDNIRHVGVYLWCSSSASPLLSPPGQGSEGGDIQEPAVAAGGLSLRSGRLPHPEGRRKLKAEFLLTWACFAKSPNIATTMIHTLESCGRESRQSGGQSGCLTD